LNWRHGVAVAFDGRIRAIPVNVALTNMGTGVASGPEILRISVSVVPPGVSDVTKLQWGKVAIVLITNYNLVYFKIISLIKIRYFN
jgi:hypothetical protein